MKSDYIIKVYLHHRFGQKYVVGQNNADLTCGRGETTSSIWRRIRISGGLSLAIIADKILTPIMGWYGERI